jgi:hypothetical protein
VGAARAAFGDDVEILLAQGLGRSYGLSSRVFVRTLPAILESGLWRKLGESSKAPTRAVISDVGNDILYGASPAQIVDWVAECVGRLTSHTRDIVLTGLPLQSIKRQSPLATAALRTLLFPRCRLSPATILERAEAVSEGLRALAVARDLRFFPLRPEWYGLDPIHIRPRFWRAAWGQILLGEDGGPVPGAGWSEAARLYAMWPERQWLLGLPHQTPQPGVRLPNGGRVWLF